MHYLCHTLIILICFVGSIHAMGEGHPPERKERKQDTKIVTAAIAKTKISEMTPEQQILAFRKLRGKLPQVLRSITQAFYVELQQINTIQATSPIKHVGVLNNGQIVSTNETIVERWNPHNGLCVQNLPLATSDDYRYVHWVNNSLQLDSEKPNSTLWCATLCIKREGFLGITIMTLNNQAGIHATLDGWFTFSEDAEDAFVQTDKIIKVYKSYCVYDRELQKIRDCTFKVVHACAKWKKNRRRRPAPISDVTAPAAPVPTPSSRSPVTAPAAPVPTPSSRSPLAAIMTAFVAKQISVPDRFACILQ